MLETGERSKGIVGRLKAIYPPAITTNKEITSALTLDTY